MIMAAAFALLLPSCARDEGPKVLSPRAITVSSIGDAKNPLPPLASDSASGEISGLAFNGLVKYDKNLVLTGDLAERWDVLDGGLTIVFHLRKGIRFHDGQELRADDVVFTYETFRNPNVPTPYSEIFGPVKKVEAIDDYTVKVTYTEAFAPALESWGVGIMPRHVYDGKNLTDDSLSHNPIGTGPYKVSEWSAGEKIVLESYAGYFEGKPGIDKYIFRFIPDKATSFLELKTGGIDFLELDPQQYKLQTESDFFKKYFKKFRYPSFSYTYFGFNNLDPRFKDKRVRQALALAINKQEIIDGVLMGFGRPATGPFPPESWAYNPGVKDAEYSPEKAIALLKEAGWAKGKDGALEKDGEPFQFTVITNHGNDLRLKTAQIIKEHLRGIGVDMDIKVLEWQTFLHEFVNKKRFEAIIMGWNLSRDPDAYDIWHSSKTKEGEFNFISYKNNEVDRLLIDGRKTFDFKKRKAIYRRMHEILADEQPYVFLYVADALPILNKRFKGAEQAPIGIWYDFVRWRVPDNRAEWYE